MFGNINPKQIQGMMKKMGINQVDIDAKRVVIECEDKNIIIENPSVAKIVMQGQASYQISGEEREDDVSLFSEDDISMIIEKTGKSREVVIKSLEKNDGDIASTIMELS